MPRLEWLKTFETGVPEIDTQHRRLVERAAEIRQRLVAGQGCQDLVGRFADELIEHFRTEEEILDRHHFPHVHEHRGRHDELMARARQIVGLCNGAGHECPAVDCIEALADFLIADILESDLRFKSFLEEARATSV
jgi:hemerythrin